MLIHDRAMTRMLRYARRHRRATWWPPCVVVGALVGVALGRALFAAGPLACAAVCGGVVAVAGVLLCRWLWRATR